MLSAQLTHARVYVCAQERLLHVLCGADVEHEGRAEYGTYGDVQPALEAAEAEREGRLPEALRAEEEGVRNRDEPLPRRKSWIYTPIDELVCV